MSFLLELQNLKQKGFLSNHFMFVSVFIWILNDHPCDIWGGAPSCWYRKFLCKFGGMSSRIYCNVLYNVGPHQCIMLIMHYSSSNIYGKYFLKIQFFEFNWFSSYHTWILFTLKMPFLSFNSDRIPLILVNLLVGYNQWRFNVLFTVM